MTLSRDLLAKAFPDSPRLVGELEELADFLDNARTEVEALLASAKDANDRLDAIESTGTQPFSERLTAIADLEEDVGAIELLGDGQVGVRGIDTGDIASLPSRGTVMLYGGKGTTAQRPGVAAGLRAIYFDTTLAAAGQPIFWTGTAWVDADGAAA